MFKRKYKSRESFRYPQGFEISNNHIFLPKDGWVGFRNNRYIKGKSKDVTVFKEIDHWCISIQTETKIDDPVHPSTKAVGIDLGIKEDDCLVGWDIHPADQRFSVSAAETCGIVAPVVQEG